MKLHGLAKDDLEPSNIVDREEQQTVQKVVGNASNMPMTLSAIGVALFSLATMLGARLWRQTPASGDNMELPAGGSARREFIATVAGAAGAAVATPALADTDYAGLPY